jgi:hypothetical protein
LFTSYWDLCESEIISMIIHRLNFVPLNGWTQMSSIEKTQERVKFKLSDIMIVAVFRHLTPKSCRFVHINLRLRLLSIDGDSLDVRVSRLTTIIGDRACITPPPPTPPSCNLKHSASVSVVTRRPCNAVLTCYSPIETLQIYSIYCYFRPAWSVAASLPFLFIACFLWSCHILLESYSIGLARNRKFDCADRLAQTIDRSPQMSRALYQQNLIYRHSAWHIMRLIIQLFA